MKSRPKGRRNGTDLIGWSSGSTDLKIGCRHCRQVCKYRSSYLENNYRLYFQPILNNITIQKLLKSYNKKKLAIFRVDQKVDLGIKSLFLPSSGSFVWFLMKKKTIC